MAFTRKNQQVRVYASGGGFDPNQFNAMFQAAGSATAGPNGNLMSSSIQAQQQGSKLLKGFNPAQGAMGAASGYMASRAKQQGEIASQGFRSTSNGEAAVNAVGGAASALPGMNGQIAQAGNAAGELIGGVWQNKNMGEGVSTATTGEAAVTNGIKGAASGFAIGNQFGGPIGGIIGGGVGLAGGAVTGILGSNNAQERAALEVKKRINNNVDMANNNSAAGYGSQPLMRTGGAIFRPSQRKYAGGGSFDDGNKGRSYVAKDNADYDFRVQKLQDSTDVYSQNNARNAQIQQQAYKMQNVNNRTGANILALGQKPNWLGASQGTVQPSGNGFMVPDVRSSVHNPTIPSAMVMPGMDPVSTQMGTKAVPGYWKGDGANQQLKQPGAIPVDAVDAYRYQAPRVTDIQRPQPQAAVQPPPAPAPAPTPQPQAIVTRPSQRPVVQRPAPAPVAAAPAPVQQQPLPGRFQPNVPMTQDSTRPVYQNRMHQQAVQRAEPQYNQELYNAWQVKAKPAAPQHQLANPNMPFPSREKGGTIPVFRKGGAVILGGQLHAEGGELGKGNPITKGGEKVAETEREELMLDITNTQAIMALVKRFDDKQDANALEEIGQLMQRIITEETIDHSGTYNDNGKEE